MQVNVREKVNWTPVLNERRREAKALLEDNGRDYRRSEPVAA